MAEPTEARIAAYAAQARKLLPLGLIWAIRTGTPYGDFVDGLATEFARVESRFAEAELEIDPRTTTELISDWERNLGLPGECASNPTTTIARRAAITAKLASQGGQSVAYYTTLAATLGWEIEIEEYPPPAIERPTAPMVAGSACTELYVFAWTVHAPPAAFDVFQAGQSGAGDPLVSANLNELLECTLRALRPAHTSVLFEYDLPPAHEWGPWDEIAPGSVGLELKPVAPVVTNPY